MGLCSAAHGVVRREGGVLAHPATVALSGRSVVITSPMMTDATGHHPVITDEMVPHKRVMRASYWLRGSVAHARVAVPDAGLVHLARCVAVAGSESAAPHSLPAGVAGGGGVQLDLQHVVASVQTTGSRLGVSASVPPRRFREGLVFKANRLLYHSTLGSRAIKRQKKYLPDTHSSR